MTTSKSNDTISSQDKFKQAYQLAGEAASDIAGNIKQQTKSQIDTNKDKASELGDKAENLIKARPLLSIGCAFAAGWAISRLMK